MSNELSNRLKKIELELTALKTASLYTSVKSSYTSYSQKVRTGYYRIDYDNKGQSILSFFFTDKTDLTNSYPIYARTPQGSAQIIEVDTTYNSATSGSPTPETYELNLVIVSNVPVIGITRIA